MEAKWINKEIFPDHQNDIGSFVRAVYPEQRPNNVLPFGVDGMRELLAGGGRICGLYEEEDLLAYFYLSQAKKIIESIVTKCSEMEFEKAPLETGRYSQYALVGGFLLKKDLGTKLRVQMPKVVKGAVLKVLEEDPRFATVDKILIKVTNEERGENSFVENPFMKRFIQSLNKIPGNQFQELEAIQRGHGLPCETVYLARIKKNQINSQISSPI